MGNAKKKDSLIPHLLYHMDRLNMSIEVLQGYLHKIAETEDVDSGIYDDPQYNTIVSHNFHVVANSFHDLWSLAHELSEISEIPGLETNSIGRLAEQIRYKMLTLSSLCTSFNEESNTSPYALFNGLIHFLDDISEQVLTERSRFHNV